MRCTNCPWLSWLAGTLVSVVSATADTNIQVTLSREGLLSWTNADPNLYYSVEWRPSLSSSNNWTGSYRGLQDINSSNQIVTVPVPMFFRLSGSATQMHTRTLNPDSATLREGYYAGTNLNAIDPDLDGAHIRLGITVFGVEGQLVPGGATATAADVAAGKTFFGFEQTNWLLQVGTAGTYACAADFFDLNGLAYDECEFQLDRAGIYVSLNDPAAADDGGCGLGPVGTGANNHPCRSIARGLQRAIQTGHTNVYVANGVYQEIITLSNGKNLLGGYNPTDWSRDVENSLTIVRGTNAALHKKLVVGGSLTQSVVMEGFVFFGQPADQPSGNSYVIWLSQCNAPVTLRHNVLFAANGADGARGPDGVNGASAGQPAAAGSNSISLSVCAARLGPAGSSGICAGGA